MEDDESHKADDISIKIDAMLEEAQPLFTDECCIYRMEDDESHMAEEISNKINAMLEKAQPLLRNECCIYRVPHEIRKINEDAYTPKVVSIGPFHHGDPKLLKMEEQKRFYCRQFIERSELKNWKTFVSCVQKLEPQVRACYSDDIKLSKKEHVMVILVDCCFILEFLLEFHSKSTLCLPPRLANYVHYDLLLLENQVPFFVLNELYNLAFPSTSSPSLLNLTWYVLPHDIISGDTGWLLSVLTDVDRIVHFTDLSRKLLLISSNLFLLPSSRRRSKQVTRVYSATELNEAGVKFVVNRASECLLDLQLSGLTLRIPPIRVGDFTEVVLRNLLAFEQCHYIGESYLADYIFVIDFLINTDKDVDLLIKKGIIENWLGDSNAVAKMFNDLAVNIFTSDFNTKYSNILKNLNYLYQELWKQKRASWNQKKASLVRDYCNTEWRALASIAGIVLLILTIVQTVFSILQVEL